MPLALASIGSSGIGFEARFLFFIIFCIPSFHHQVRTWFFLCEFVTALDSSSALARRVPQSKPKHGRRIILIGVYIAIHLRCRLKWQEITAIAKYNVMFIREIGSPPASPQITPPQAL